MCLSFILIKKNLKKKHISENSIKTRLIGEKILKGINEVDFLIPFKRLPQSSRSLFVYKRNIKYKRVVDTLT